MIIDMAGRFVQGYLRLLFQCLDSPSLVSPLSRPPSLTLSRPDSPANRPCWAHCGELAEPGMKGGGGAARHISLGGPASAAAEGLSA